MSIAIEALGAGWFPCTASLVSELRELGYSYISGIVQMLVK